MIGTVYKIVLRVHDKSGPIPCDTIHMYVGSTGKTLKTRFANHTSMAAGGAKSALYDRMRAASDVKIMAIESGKFETERALRAREEYYRRLLMPDLNVRRCSLTEAEKAAYSKKKCADYYQKHKDTLSARALSRYYRLKAAQSGAGAEPIPTNS